MFLDPNTEWRWHAAEEIEHRAVAFDVYRATGGSYLVRVVTMFMVTAYFWPLVFVQQVRLMGVDGCLFSRREWTELNRFVLGIARRLFRPYLSYLAPRFHPKDHDASGLVDAWRAELERSPVYARALAP